MANAGHGISLNNLIELKAFEYVSNNYDTHYTFFLMIKLHKKTFNSKKCSPMYYYGMGLFITF